MAKTIKRLVFNKQIGNFTKTLRPTLLTPFKCKDKKRLSFTLSECLITLTIIGIIAAMTIPNLISKYQKSIVEARLSSTYSILSNAFSLSVTENGPIEEWYEPPHLSTPEFMEKYLLPYLKHKPKQIPGYAIYASNGQAIANHFANQQTWSLDNGTILTAQIITNPTNFDAAYFGVDINGKKGPNRLGYDVFAFFITVTKPMRFDTCNSSGGGCNRSIDDLLNAPGNDNVCSVTSMTNGGKYIGQSCTRVIQLSGWKIPDNYPIKF